ncbi:MAG: hypothetical protein CBC29_03625 [Methylococcaceae bacterium TMED69]|nr:MAG: hypothetical protein CBC29_03625 [Methylococcaceae bacterium TMED69]|tara:strand:+ start:137 stop:451 length:315 start_codon:yes stop_codon:yes gene_type:complete
MNRNSKTAVSLSILGKEYLIGCTIEEREDLALSADYLNKKLEEQRMIGKVIGNEKTAVITALNITSDYLKLLKHNESIKSGVGEGINRIQKKIGDILAISSKGK